MESPKSIRESEVQKHLNALRAAIAKGDLDIAEGRVTTYLDATSLSSDLMDDADQNQGKHGF